MTFPRRLRSRVGRVAPTMSQRWQGGRTAAMRPSLSVRRGYGRGRCSWADRTRPANWISLRPSPTRRRGEAVGVT